ncbi:MAG: hypothetical protein ABFS35_22515 [Bacteroidota bacterium]
MTNLQLNLKPDTHKKFMNILSMYSNEDVFFQKVINYQINLLENEIINFRTDLDDLEKKYNMSSEKFYKLYKKSKTDDSEDTLLWAGLYEMFLENENKIAELQK